MADPAETCGRRKLSNRHVQFIAFGGAIGAGLFLGSGEGIARAGPSLLVAYAVCGAFIYLVLRALGELAVADPVRGSFTTYAERYLGEVPGFITGWSYWANWMLAGGAEITAVGIFVKLWFPAQPQWIPALAALLLIYGINMRGVRLFGELEFWFALLKILAILSLIAIGSVLLVWPRLWPVPGAGIQNLWVHGGFFPHGLSGFGAVLPAALFAFGGVEVIGLTAAETERPEKALPRAINGVIVRILVFYIGSLAIILSLAPWTGFAAGFSPFVESLRRIGVPCAGDIINLVVITAAVSSCSTGLFATGRTLAALAERQQAPSYFAYQNGIPTRAISASAVALGGVVLLNWLIPTRVWGYIVSASALLLLWVWLVIMLAHISFRRRQGRAGSRLFALPGYPWSSVAVVCAIGGAATMLLAVSTSRPAILIVVAWFVGLTVVQRAIAARPPRPTATVSNSCR